MNTSIYMLYPFPFEAVMVYWYDGTFPRFRTGFDSPSQHYFSSTHLDSTPSIVLPLRAVESMIEASSLEDSLQTRSETHSRAIISEMQFSFTPHLPQPPHNRSCS